MKIEKFTYHQSTLSSLTKKQLSAFLLLGLFLNEMNWLQKLAIITSTDKTGGEADQASRLSLSVLLTKLMAAKMNEGWNRINNQLNDVLSSLPANKKIADLHSKLKQKLAKGSVTYEIRTKHASHYPIELSLNGLPNISEDEIALYMTENLGDVLSTVSDLSSVAEMLKSTTGSTCASAKDLGKIIKEVYEAAKIYCEYIAEVLAVFVTNFLKDKQSHSLIENEFVADLNAIRLPFFMKI